MNDDYMFWMEILKTLIDDKPISKWHDSYKVEKGLKVANGFCTFTLNAEATSSGFTYSVYLKSETCSYLCFTRKDGSSVSMKIIISKDILPIIVDFIAELHVARLKAATCTATLIQTKKELHLVTNTLNALKAIIKT